MGDPKRIRKKYETLKKRWNKEVIEREKKTVEFYGLKNKKEIRKTETLLRRKRQNARKIFTLQAEEKVKKEKELIESLKRIGLLKSGATLDDVLETKMEELLERRLQTLVWRKGLANTVKQARQFIVHGHIAIDGKKITIPSYIVTPKEEEKIQYYKKEMQIKPKEKKREFKKGVEGETAEKEEIPAKEEKIEKEIKKAGEERKKTAKEKKEKKEIKKAEKVSGERK